MDKGKLDVYSAQIVCQYLKKKEDFLNIIQVKKQFQFLLDRMRINPIPVTKETKNLFQCLDTQQIFENKAEEILLNSVKIIQYNYEMKYSKYLKKKEESEKQIKGKKMKFHEK